MFWGGHTLLVSDINPGCCTNGNETNVSFQYVPYYTISRHYSTLFEF